jgi:hypothetical protein
MRPGGNQFQGCFWAAMQLAIVSESHDVIQATTELNGQYFQKRESPLRNAHPMLASLPVTVSVAQQEKRPRPDTYGRVAPRLFHATQGGL